MIRPTVRALPCALVLVLCAAIPASAAPTAPAVTKPAEIKVAPAGAAASASAPFYVGHPMGAAFGAIQKQRIARAKASIAQVLAVKGPRTIANTLVPYDEALRQLDMASSQSGLISETSPDEKTRDAAEKATQDVSAFATELSLNRKLYDAVAAIDTSKADAATRYYVWRTVRDFKLAGVDKDDATRAQIKALSDSLVEVGQAFQRNIREDKTTVTCTAAELDGLPQDYIDRHKPAGDGTITLSIDYPDAFPIFQYAKNDGLRKRMYIAYNNRAYPANNAVLDRIRQVRFDLAKLQGYSNFADYFTADKMVGSAANAHAFIDRVVAASADRQAREYQQVLAEKKKTDPSATVVNFWEFQYVREQVRRSAYSFDSQSIRPYFPYDRVKTGVLDLASRLFDVQFRRVPNAPVWDPSVECYEVLDHGKLAGRFYLDMHPRDNKYKHAANFGIRTGIAGKQIPESALICNLPGGEKGDPGLCDVNDVDTFFHEFGHLLHGMFAGHGRWAGIGGISTEQDFVEAPSQMLEEWMKSPEVLATFAKHYQTNEPIPADLVRQMNRANAFGKGLDVRRQMVYAATSLACYDGDPSTPPTDEVMSTFVKQYQPFPYVEGTHFQCSFGHLLNYAAGYYTYMWSLVIAKDLFSKFDKAHLLEPGVASQYRNIVLAPGGSKPAADLVSNFLGRPFNEKAWKAWLDSDD